MIKMIADFYFVTWVITRYRWWECLWLQRPCFGTENLYLHWWAWQYRQFAWSMHKTGETDGHHGILSSRWSFDFSSKQTRNLWTILDKEWPPISEKIDILRPSNCHISDCQRNGLPLVKEGRYFFSRLTLMYLKVIFHYSLSMPR